LARLGGAVAAVLLMWAVLVPLAPRKAGAAAAVPTRRLWVQGDSVLLGAMDDVEADFQGDGWSPTVIAWGGLQLITAVQIFQTHQADVGDVVVILLGNNFCCDISQFGPQIDEAMTVLGHRHVIWLTTSLFEPRQVQINALIRARAARWPNAEVADWAAEVQANPQAVGPDDLHLTLAGRALLASFIQARVDAWYRQFTGPSRPFADAYGAAVAGGPRAQQVSQGVPAGIAPTPDGGGYWVAHSDGTVSAQGDAAAVSPPPRAPTAAPVVGIAASPSGGGYWLAHSDGTVDAAGDAAPHGSVGTALNEPVVGIAATPDGGGYWLVAADGGVFAFGDAVFRGSLGAVRLNQPIVGITTTPDGAGYWLVASDGGVFAFGDAHFEGSTGALRLNRPIQSMAATRDGKGYWLVAQDGGVFTFGDATYHGSGAGPALMQGDYVAIAATPSGDGYWLLGADPP
jgi:hypothetical protein